MKRLYRMLWHLVGGSFFPILSIFVTRKILLLSLGSISLIIFSIEAARFFYPKFNEIIYRRLHPVLKEDEKIGLTGTTYLLVAALFVFAFFEKEIAAISLLFVSVGDLTAVIVGKRYGHIRVFNKSIEGSIACFLSCILIGAVFYFLGFIGSFIVILAGAAAATLIELLPTRINDNLTVPVASAVVMFLADMLISYVR